MRRKPCASHWLVVDVVAAVDALQRLVGLRVDEGGDLEREGLSRRLRQRQRGVGELVVLLAERPAVEGDVAELELLAVELQLLAAACRLGVGTDSELGAHARARRLERDVEVHPVDQIGGGPIVLQMDRPGSLELHGITVPPHPGAFGCRTKLDDEYNEADLARHDRAARKSRKSAINAGLAAVGPVRISDPRASRRL